MIRSLTIGLPIGLMSTSEIEEKTLHLISQARRACEARGMEIRTIRFTLPVASASSETLEGADLVALLAWVDKLATKAGVRWYCLPLDLSDNARRDSRISIALRSVRKYPKLFLNLIVSNGSTISLSGIAEASKLVLDISKGGKAGFDNFRVGISSGVEPNSPFFPSSSHEGSQIKFSFALETVSLAATALENASQAGEVSISYLREVLAKTLTSTLTHVDEFGKTLEEDSDFEYAGLDASFAPLPVFEHSVVRLLRFFRPLGDTSWGGFLAVTALATDVIRESIVVSGAKSIGFNGVMFSVLEDPLLAEAINRREIDISYLTALSSVCGCGIDMVPIPGGTFPEEIASVVLDLCAMSLSLGKPLGVRLLPIPNMHVGDYTAFNMEFLCDSRIVSPPGSSGNFKYPDKQVNLRFPLKSGWQNSDD